MASINSYGLLHEKDQRFIENLILKSPNLDDSSDTFGLQKKLLAFLSKSINPFGKIIKLRNKFNMLLEKFSWGKVWKEEEEIKLEDTQGYKVLLHLLN